MHGSPGSWRRRAKAYNEEGRDLISVFKVSLDDVFGQGDRTGRPDWQFHRCDGPCPELQVAT